MPASLAPSIDIGIPAGQRQGIAEGLGRFLADSSVLYGKTHGFHWNVSGPMFNTLQERSGDFNSSNAQVIAPITWEIRPHNDDDPLPTPTVA